MTFEQLHYFLEIAKDMNFTKAANRLFISQSTLSRQIAALESDLGARLLIRDTRSVELTEAGALLMKEGSELFAKKAEIEEKIWRLSEGLSGKINLISIPMRTNEVYDICRRFQLAHPSISLNLATKVLGSTVEQLMLGVADVGVGISCELENAPDELEFLPITQDSFYLIVPEHHRLAELECVSALDVKGENILVAQEPIASRLCVDVHLALGVETKHRRELTQPNTLEEMLMQVRAGLGLAVLPGVMCRENDGYRKLRIDSIASNFDVVMIWKKSTTNPSMEAFKQIAREALSAPRN